MICSIIPGKGINGEYAWSYLRKLDNRRKEKTMKMVVEWSWDVSPKEYWGISITFEI